MTDLMIRVVLSVAGLLGLFVSVAWLLGAIQAVAEWRRARRDTQRPRMPPPRVRLVKRPPH